MHGLQSVFAQNWIEETHCLPAGGECFPEIEPMGDISAHVVSSASGSLALNEEVGVGILDAGIAAQLKAAFNKDLRRCRELKLEEWRRRPLFDRAFERVAYLVHEQL